jgi:hypothetical protein
MPQWLVGEIGYVLAIMGFSIIVFEWLHVFKIQGNTLNRESLRAYLAEWRTGASPEGRTTIVDRMKATVEEIEDRTQRGLFAAYVAQLSDIDPAATRRLDELDRAFAVGTPIEEWEKRSQRRKLMIVGAVLVVVGSVGQMVSTYPKPFGPFCKSEIWTCPHIGVSGP